jgi:hypothetical protein
VGAAYLVSGAYIATLFPGATSAHAAELPTPFPLADSNYAMMRILGQNTGDELGYEVSLLPHLGANQLSGIAVGAIYSSSLGFDRSGALFGYAYDPTKQDLETLPIFAMIGETLRADSNMGIAIDTLTYNSKSLIAVGASLISTISLDQGACFVIDASGF